MSFFGSHCQTCAYGYNLGLLVWRSLQWTMQVQPSLRAIVTDTSWEERYNCHRCCRKCFSDLKALFNEKEINTKPQDIDKTGTPTTLVPWHQWIPMHLNWPGYVFLFASEEHKQNSAVSVDLGWSLPRTAGINAWYHLGISYEPTWNRDMFILLSNMYFLIIHTLSFRVYPCVWDSCVLCWSQSHELCGWLAGSLEHLFGGSLDLQNGIKWKWKHVFTCPKELVMFCSHHWPGLVLKFRGLGVCGRLEGCGFMTFLFGGKVLKPGKEINRQLDTRPFFHPAGGLWEGEAATLSPVAQALLDGNALHQRTRRSGGLLGAFKWQLGQASWSFLLLLGAIKTSTFWLIHRNSNDFPL